MWIGRYGAGSRFPRWLPAAAVSVALVVGAGARPLEATPSLATTPPEVQTGAGNVLALGVSGSTVVYALDKGTGQAETCGALRVWSTTSGRTFAPTKPDCNGEFWAYDTVAVAGTMVVWSMTYETNHTWAYMY